MTGTYTTRTEAIQREIVEPILAGDVDSIDEYDVDAIAAEVLGDYSQGYACIVDEAAFWASVERHEVRTTARGWQALGGIADLVITVGAKVWVAEGTGLTGDTDSLIEGVRAIRTGEWFPTEGDGWTPVGSGFDPADWLGWMWTEVEA